LNISNQSSEFYNFFICLFSILEIWLGILHFFHLKKKTVFSVHGAPDFKHRHRPTFESHNPASMGKMLIPGDIIMQAFVTGDVHGCGMLDTRYWMLGARYWMLAAGYWMLDTGCSMLDTGCWMLDTGYSILDVRYWMLDTGCSILDTRYWILDTGPF
jgi:hypothetical protein